MIDDFIQSIQINKYEFSKAGSAEYVLNKYMNNSWPIVYIIKNDKLKEAYIGESTNAINRMKNHLANTERQRLNDVLIISCDKFNKSAVLDIESNLIQYMSSDGVYALQNGNAGLVGLDTLNGGFTPKMPVTVNVSEPRLNTLNPGDC